MWRPARQQVLMEASSYCICTTALPGRPVTVPIARMKKAAPSSEEASPPEPGGEQGRGRFRRTEKQGPRGQGSRPVTGRGWQHGPGAQASELAAASSLPRPATPSGLCPSGLPGSGHHSDRALGRPVPCPPQLSCDILTHRTPEPDHSLQSLRGPVPTGVSPSSTPRLAEGGRGPQGQLGPTLHSREGATEAGNQKNTWSRSRVAFITAFILSTPSALF